MWDVSLALWLVIAIMVFWVVGAYNRLMRIRARAMDALGSFDKHVRHYRTLITEYWQTLGISGEQFNGDAAQNTFPPLWGELFISLSQLEQHTKAARAIVPGPEQLSPIAASLDELSRVWALLCAEPDELTGPIVPGSLLSQWSDNSRRVDSARSGYNQINVKYNEAIAQFPASMLARTLRFSPAALL